MTTIFAVLLAIAVAIAASLILILIHNLRRQKKTERLLSGFDDAAAEFNLSIAKQEVLRNGVIGLDDVNNKLLFLELTGNKQDGYLIDLDEIKSCTVKKTFGTFKNGRTSIDAYVNTIALQLNYKNGAKPLVLSFYVKATDPVFEMRKRAEQAIEWQTLLSARLTKSGDAMEKRKDSAKRTNITMVEEAVSFIND